MNAEQNEHKEYLGDGVYARFDGYHVWITTDGDGWTNEIALEPPVLASLNRYAQRVSQAQPT